MTDQEYASVCARAAEIGHTVPSYLALTGLRPEGVASADIKTALISLRAMRRVHAGIANNLNQLTAKLHTTGELDHNLPTLLVTISGLSSHLDTAIDRVAQFVDGRSKR